MPVKRALADYDPAAATVAELADGLGSKRPKRSHDVHDFHNFHDNNVDISLVPNTTSPEIIVPQARNQKQQLQSRLFSLPFELRKEIYAYALIKPYLHFANSYRTLRPTAGSQNSGHWMDEKEERELDVLLDISRHPNHIDSEPPLLKTCWRIRREGLSIFYGINDWVIKTRRHNLGGNARSKEPDISHEIIPRWISCLPDEKIRLIRRTVVIGTKGSWVDLEGKWTEEERAAYRIRLLGKGGVGFAIDRIPACKMEDDEHDDDDNGKTDTRTKSCRRRIAASGKLLRRVDPKPTRRKEGIVCGVALVDLLRAKMKWLLAAAANEKGTWAWSTEAISQIACFL